MFSSEIFISFIKTTLWFSRSLSQPLSAPAPSYLPPSPPQICNFHVFCISYHCTLQAHKPLLKLLHLREMFSQKQLQGCRNHRNRITISFRETNTLQLLAVLCWGEKYTCKISIFCSQAWGFQRNMIRTLVLVSVMV